MFNRRAYKAASLQNLKGKWNQPLLVSLVWLVVIAIAFLPNLNSYAEAGNYQYSVRITSGNILSLLSPLIGGIVTMATTFFFVRFESNRETATFATFVEGLNLWLKGILATLWMGLWIFLWSLLFVIPAIVKYYSYSQIFLILAEHPSMSVRKAMDLSKIMTRGYKGNLFFQDLSFLGWVILCGLTMGLGSIFLLPYYGGTLVKSYRFLKEQALSTGILKEADFSDTY